DGNGRSHLESRLTPTSQPYPLDRREADPASEDERDSGGSCNPQRLSSRYLLRFVAHDPLFTAGAIWTSLVRTLSMSCRQTPAFSISFVSQALQRTHSLKSILSRSIAPVGQARSQTLHTLHCSTRRILNGASTEPIASAAPSGHA